MLETIIAAQAPEATAAWTSATTVNTALTVNCVGYTSIVVFLNQGSTITGGAVTFEGSDTSAFTVAYPLGYVESPPVNNTTNTIYTLQANNNIVFLVNCAGYTAFRVRLSTVISGTATVNVGIILAAGGPGYVQARIAGQPLLVEGNAGAGNTADNQPSMNYLPGTNTQSLPLAVGPWAYGGAFSGTGNANLQGWSKQRQPTVFKNIKAVSITAGTPVSVWTPGSGNKFRLLGFMLSLSVAGSILFEDATGSANEFLRTPLLAAGIGLASPNMGGFGYLSTAANNGLFLDVTASGSVSGFVFGTEE